MKLMDQHLCIYCNYDFSICLTCSQDLKVSKCHSKVVQSYFLSFCEVRFKFNSFDLLESCCYMVYNLHLVPPLSAIDFLS